MTPELVTVGGLTVDNVISSNGVVALGQVGGNAAYSAVGARCWRDRVGVVSIAASSYPRDTLDAFERNGISLDGVVTIDADLEHCDWFIYDDRGDRHERLRSRPQDLAAAGFVAERLTRDEVAQWTALLEARGAPAELSYAQFRDAHPMQPAQVPSSYFDARAVHLAPCRPVVLHGMLPLFRSKGMTISLDPGWQLAGEALDEIAPFLAQVDAFLPSEVELRALVPGANLTEALAAIADRCKAIIAVKLGSAGSMIWDRAGRKPVAVPALPTDAIDPTGAGDSFCGGFLAGLVETGDATLASCFGTVSASLIVSHFGADGALPVDQAACRRQLGGLVASLGLGDRTSG